MDQQMQGASAGQEVPGEGVDGSRILQIEGAGLHPGQPGQVGPRLFRRPGRHDDGCARGAQDPGGFQADSRIAAGDDDGPAGQVDPLDHLVRGGGGPEP